MIPLVFYNIFTSAVIGLTALAAALSLFKKSKSNKEIISLAWFWLMASGLWIAATLAYFFVWLDNKILIYFFLYWVQIFVGAHLVAASYYLINIVFNNKKLNKIIIWSWLILCFIFILLVLYNGFGEPIQSDWGDRFPLNPSTYYVFLAMVILPYTLGIYYILSFLFKIILGRPKHASYRFYSVITLFIYASVGIIEEPAFVAGWLMLLGRIIMVATVLAAYLIYTSKPTIKKLCAE